MSKHTHFPVESTILGVLTTTTAGAWLFQALSVFALAILGALGGWVFGRFIKPVLDKVFKPKSSIESNSNKQENQ